MTTSPFRRLIAVFAAFAVFAALLAPLGTPVSADPPNLIYLPMVAKSGTQPVIANHTTTDISQIPDYWLAQAKLLAIHYAHTSHGGQILEGMAYLKTYVDSKYDYAVSYGTPPTLPAGTNKLKFYDGNNYGGNNYITPEMYWASADGITHSQSVISTGLFQYSTWTWCGQQSDNATTTVQSYLNTLNGFETLYPNTRIIYFTGHTDGTQDNLGSILQRNNQMVRDYVNANGKILFDFADIESYDPAGNYYPNTTDGCAWCTTWCTNHPSDCLNLPSCAHSHGLQCKLKAQAFWWMMARLAGWPGPSTE